MKPIWLGQHLPLQSQLLAPKRNQAPKRGLLRFCFYFR